MARGESTTSASRQGLLDRFAVQAEVGQGASGVVFRAFDVRTEQEVALKLLLPREGVVLDAAEFLREGQLLAGIDHPGVVRIVDFGTVEAESLAVGGRTFGRGTPYLAMEWLAGQDLQRRHAARPLSLEQSLGVARQIAAALATVHHQQIAHRDVKPSNVFVLDGEPNDDAAPQVKLVDFGVARCGDHAVDAVGPMVGTPAYMAPEQARGDPDVDVRCDLYALGATLFELVSGHPPHAGPSPIATLVKLVSTPAPRLAELVVDVPAAVDDLVADLLQQDPSRRPSAPQAEQRLAALCTDPGLPRVGVGRDQQLESVHSSTSRLVTTFVALQVATGEQRDRELDQLREEGAEAVRLGRDSIVAFLGARRAHGPEAVRALEMGRRLGEVGARVGVATGRALVDLPRPIGVVVDHASALARDAEPGQLLADETTAELARGRFRFAAGRQGSSVVGPATDEPRRGGHLAPFVGRQTELQKMVEAFERSVREPCPVVVSASGPPGIGKSRLCREFLETIRSSAGAPALVELSPAVAEPVRDESMPPSSAVRPTDVRVLQLRSDAYGRSRALGLAADALSDLLRLPRGASRQQVRRALAPYDLAHDEDGLLASLLAGQPLAPEVGVQRARDVLYLVMTELVRKALGDGPCMFVLEDAQWADPESVAWFDHLLARSAGHALFVVVLARPGFWKDDPQRFAARDHRYLELRPIGQRATREIARAVIGCEADHPKLEQVARQAAGSPLFAEELARVIAAGKPVDHVPTIEAAIQVSLDALAPEVRDALVRMSVLGLTGWDAGLAALGIDRPQAALARLVEADLLVEQAPARFAGTRQYLFKHALVRDVAYASASDTMRAELHAKAAAWFADVGEDAATIAEHYDRGGEHARAAEYWETAARRALLANSLQDAVKMADRALTFAERRETAFARATLLDEAYSRLDERSSERSEAIEAMSENAHDEASEVRTMGARARYDHARSAGVDVAERLQEVMRRSAELGLTDEEARSAATLATRYAYAGELARAEQEAAHLLELAELRSVVPAAVDAWQTLAVVHQTRGELVAALDARRNSAKAARSAGLKQREATLTINLGFALTTIGAKAESRSAIEAGIRMAEEIGSPGTVRLGRMILLGWAAHFGSDPSLDEALAEPRASADEAATGVWMVQDRVTLGVLFYRGCELLRESGAGLRRARALLRLSTEAYRATDNRDVLPVALGYWAEAARRLGEVERAEQIASEAADLVEAGAPSLLNEAIIFLALHAARVGLGDLSGARHAIERAMPPLLRRVRGLESTAYVRDFLLGLEHNAQLLEVAEAQGCVPAALERIL